MSDNNKAVKIKESTDESKQLEVFIKSLGYDGKTDMYKYMNKVYMNSNIIIPVLSVDIDWFIKNSKQPLHYIVIKKNIYVNKYGLTKLIAHSNEIVAFQLQDYIYDVIYKLEKDGFVELKYVESRKKLVKTIAELDVYKSVDFQNKITLEENKEEISQLHADFSILNDEYEKINKSYKDLEELYSESKKEIKYITDISKKLAKYVRFNTKSKPDILFNIENSDEDEPEYVDNKRIEKEALIAKKKLIRPVKSTNNKYSKILVNNTNTKEYYCMRSAQPVLIDKNSNIIYKWVINTELPYEGYTFQVDNIIYDSFRDYCNDYRLGGMDDDDISEILFRSIHITDEKYVILSSIFSVLSYGDENLFNSIIDVFIN